MNVFCPYLAAGLQNAVGHINPDHADKWDFSALVALFAQHTPHAGQRQAARATGGKDSAQPANGAGSGEGLAGGEEDALPAPEGPSTPLSFPSPAARCHLVLARMFSGILTHSMNLILCAQSLANV